ncbi:hypothetical protein ACFYQ5_18505 [Streptomyces sp. NPDC005794]|uniref:hypothetical protein n=1 Tax=Streptomyces sp. NPDC005794 TaxID=3364733 RepID=UPI0036BEC4BE
MRDRIARLFELLVRRPAPATKHRPGGITTRCTGERPPRGEDSPLVRPYYVAHERERLAELRRRRVLVVARCGGETAA